MSGLVPVWFPWGVGSRAPEPNEPLQWALETPPSHAVRRHVGLPPPCPETQHLVQTIFSLVTGTKRARLLLAFQVFLQQAEEQTPCCWVFPGLVDVGRQAAAPEGLCGSAARRGACSEARRRGCVEADLLCGVVLEISGAAG